MNKPVVQSLDSILRKVGGEAVRRKGFGNEDRILHAFEVARVQTPVWFREIFPANKGKEDREGKDFIVITDIGQIFLQSKSSRYFADKFCRRQIRHLSNGTNHKRAGRRYNKYIAVVVIEENDTDEQICYKVFRSVGKKRQKLLELRSRTV